MLPEQGLHPRDTGSGLWDTQPRQSSIISHIWNNARVLRWGDRDMLRPSDQTREKKKRKTFQTLFFFLFVRGRIFYRGNQDVTCPGVVGCLVL